MYLSIYLSIYIIGIILGCILGALLLLLLITILVVSIVYYVWKKRITSKYSLASVDKLEGYETKCSSLVTVSKMLLVSTVALVPRPGYIRGYIHSDC